MKKFFSLVLLFATFSMYNPVLAKTVEVKEGTRITITVKEQYTSKNIEAGQTRNAAIDEDISVNNVLIFKKGDNATIKGSDAKKAGFIGNAGEIYLVNGEVTDAKGNKHSIEYNQKITGEEQTWTKVCLGCGVFIILAPLALFGFVKGGQAKINPNKVIEVSVRNGF